jgi:hypothetical protein
VSFAISIAPGENTSWKLRLDLGGMVKALLVGNCYFWQIVIARVQVKDISSWTQLCRLLRVYGPRAARWLHFNHS